MKEDPAMVVIKHLLFPLLVIYCLLEFEAVRAADDLEQCRPSCSGRSLAAPVSLSTAS
ncbi:hypothetical protein [Pseudomonas sp. Q1-7]|uniref:hypothetical protein n=1 Tax=Pseudomonas sp. Q1-7 TaxID=3020843 RepID=UPI002301EA67|nr:hypothetical protein [Pseudomonas sp. Q1-7]